MFIHLVYIFISLIFPLIISAGEDRTKITNPDIVIATKRIFLKQYPEAFNPSIFKADKGFLLIFRNCPDRVNQPWINEIGIVHLNDSFEPIADPVILNTRLLKSKIPSQAEDARIFSYKGRLFLIYNDNLKVINPSYWDRRDMFIAELLSNEDHFTLSSPLKLICEEKYHTQLWQKNWIPFEWEGKLLMTYSINPHEILYTNLLNGACYSCYKTAQPLEWDLGTLKGSTPAQIVDGEYLAFFHSGTITSSPASWGSELWHYFMGAYTFSAEPPFNITKYTRNPIISDGFYTLSYSEKRVIYPGGFVVAKPFIYLAYGKDDEEMWIAILNLAALKAALEVVQQK